MIQQNAECLGEQARQLAALLQERENRERSAKLAAQAIKSYLGERGSKPVDLLELPVVFAKRSALPYKDQHAKTFFLPTASVDRQADRTSQTKEAQCAAASGAAGAIC